MNTVERGAFLQYREWFERDRQHVELTDSNDVTILEFWDDDVTEAVNDGFLDPQNYKGSILEYAKELGLIEDTFWIVNNV